MLRVFYGVFEMPPAVRLGDSTQHGTPLAPGTGSLNVLIGNKPAWRAVPASVGAGLQAVQQAGDAAAKVAESATKAASGTPGQAAALAAEALAKTTATAAFANAVAGATSALVGATALTGAGTPDTHVCGVPLTAPVPAPHGPGIVLQGSSTVLINGLPATRVGDKVVEALGGPNPIVAGEFSVMIG